jgi:hypothetical protein
VRGYADLVAWGKLKDGARDLKHIPAFFKLGKVSMAGLSPQPERCGANTRLALCSASSSTMVLYVTTAASVSVRLPSSGAWTVRCFNVLSGAFVATYNVTGSTARVSCPVSGDFAALLRRL